jgi:hypothetical protein
MKFCLVYIFWWVWRNLVENISDFLCKIVYKMKKITELVRRPKKIVDHITQPPKMHGF